MSDSQDPQGLIAGEIGQVIREGAQVDPAIAAWPQAEEFGIRCDPLHTAIDFDREALTQPGVSLLIVRNRIQKL